MRMVVVAGVVVMEEEEEEEDVGDVDDGDDDCSMASLTAVAYGWHLLSHQRAPLMQTGNAWKETTSC